MCARSAHELNNFQSSNFVQLFNFKEAYFLQSYNEEKCIRVAFASLPVFSIFEEKSTSEV